MTYQQALVDNLITVADSKAFLGREFLTWLWHLAETESSDLRVQLPESKSPVQIDLWVDDRIVFHSPIASQHMHTLKGGDPSHSVEAAAALVTGKYVKELKVGMRLPDSTEFHCSLDCSDLSPRGLKVLKPKEESSEEPLETVAFVSARLESLETFFALLDGFVSRFITERTADEWADEGAKKIRSWIKSRSTSGPTVH